MDVPERSSSAFSLFIESYLPENLDLSQYPEIGAKIYQFHKEPFQSENLIDHLVRMTNIKLSNHSVKLDNKEFQIHKEDMMNFLILHTAHGLVRTTSYREKWMREGEAAELFHNDFFSNTMTRTKFELINKYFDCDLSFVHVYFHYFSNLYKQKTNAFSFDDDLHHWRGRGGGKMKNDKKKC